MQCSVLLYSLLYKYCCTAVWRPPPPQCSYCSRHRLSGRRSYLHPQFTAQLVGACSYWHLGTEHVFLWPCAYYYYFLRLKFLTTKFLTGDAVCIRLPECCVCVFSSHPFWTSSSLDVPAGVTQEEGHTGFLIHLPSAVRALIFVARRIQRFLSLVDREVEFCVLTN